MLHFIIHTAVVGCSERTMQRYRQAYNERGVEGLTDGRSNNRTPRRTTEAQDAAMVAAMRANSFNAATHVLQDLDLNISARTVRRRMHEAGLKNCAAALKIPLEARHCQARLAFANSVEHMTPEEWRTVIFTDEKIFSSDKDCRRTVWRERGERYHPDNILPKHRSGRVTAMFWGWISGEGPGEIVEIDRRMNAELYIEILEEVMIPSVRALYPEDEMPVIRIVEDNSAVHRARIVRNWYDEHPEVQRFDWPAKSPDLNLIENVWSKMEEGWTPVERERRAGLCRRVHAVWEELRAERGYFAELVQSMPRRIRKVIRAEGGHVNY